MIIDCISDLHGQRPELEGGDLLIVAGDLTSANVLPQYDKFLEWLSQQKYGKKVFIAGNHDGILTKVSGKYISNPYETVEYLQDSGCEFHGYKIWGSPWTPTFYNWYFMKDRGPEIKEKWDLIPPDTDILVTHGPPYGVLDKVLMSSRANAHGFAGCNDLRQAIERIQPKLHVFGHVHESYGKVVLKCLDRDIICVNASVLDEKYDMKNKPIRVVL